MTECTLVDSVDKEDTVDSDDDLYIHDSETEFATISIGESTSSTDGGPKPNPTAVILNKIYVPPLNKEYSTEEIGTEVITARTLIDRNEDNSSAGQSAIDLASKSKQVDSIDIGGQVCE